jgi:hypothetical protein
VSSRNLSGFRRDASAGGGPTLTHGLPVELPEWTERAAVPLGKIPNYRLVKTHRSFTVEEVATLLGVHRNTVRHWIKSGLAVCDGRRPILVLGSELADYLQKRRVARRRPCEPGHLYCVRCRTPKYPALGMADFFATSATLGNIQGLCPECGTVMNRRVNVTKLDQVRGDLNVRLMGVSDT